MALNLRSEHDQEDSQSRQVGPEESQSRKRQAQSGGALLVQPMTRDTWVYRITRAMALVPVLWVLSIVFTV